ncbi:hypothetical protein [Streptomonospora sediminis]
MEDECSWLISPDGVSDWQLDLSYTAYIEPYGNTSVIDRAKQLARSTEQEYVSSIGEEVKSPGKNTWGDSAAVLYEPGGGGSGGGEYVVIMRKKGVVCELEFRAMEQGVEVDETSFEVEADPALTALAQEIHHLLPD